ncbi:hypothetical protein AGMMS50239_09910 [Bacteroidia bacterium]|nr:hypothetical protein AGMMS50239_09910 [Bacteroidia bacterium]
MNIKININVTIDFNNKVGMCGNKEDVLKKYQSVWENALKTTIESELQYKWINSCEVKIEQSYSGSWFMEVITYLSVSDYMSIGMLVHSIIKDLRNKKLEKKFEEKVNEAVAKQISKINPSQTNQIIIIKEFKPTTIIINNIIQ